VDYQGLNDEVKSSVSSSSYQSNQTNRNGFGDKILRRDGLFCAVTQAPAASCDAARLIPSSKRDEVVLMIIQRGSSLMIRSTFGSS
jgi:hypothetical protein